jgi:hypothetical protein
MAHVARIGRTNSPRHFVWETGELIEKPLETSSASCLRFA